MRQKRHLSKCGATLFSEIPLTMVALLWKKRSISMFIDLEVKIEIKDEKHSLEGLFTVLTALLPILARTSGSERSCKRPQSSPNFIWKPFCSHHSRNFQHFLFNFTYVVFPREGLGGGYWGPGCCQIDHLCFFSPSVRPLSKSWHSIGSQSLWRRLLWCVRGAGPCIDNSTPLLFSFFLALFNSGALSGATNVL